MNFRTTMLVLTGTFLVVSFGYAATTNIPLERIQDKDGVNTYKNNFLGMQISTPSSITTRVPVSSFQRAPGDRMFFNAEGNIRAIAVILHYGKFDMKSYVHNYNRCGGSSYEQIKGPFNIVNFIESNLINEAYASVESGCYSIATLKVDLEERNTGGNKFFYYALLEKKSGKKEHYFIYLFGEDFIEFAFFNQPEDLILNIMKSIQFFKGDHENPNYPYWPH